VSRYVILPGCVLSSDNSGASAGSPIFVFWKSGGFSPNIIKSDGELGFNRNCAYADRIAPRRRFWRPSLCAFFAATNACDRSPGLFALWSVPAKMPAAVWIVSASGVIAFQFAGSHCAPKFVANKANSVSVVGIGSSFAVGK
jgi:hypothetical protein